MPKVPILPLLFVMLISAFLGQPIGWALPLSQPLEKSIEKITFDLNRLSADGLTGPETGKRSVSYEFCIPATEVHLAAVQAIDPSVQYFPTARGRIGCGNDQYLCIGHTHQPGWREILLKIADLTYVERIDQFFGE